MNYVLKSSERRRSLIPLPLKIVGATIIVLVIFHFIMPRVLPTFFTTLVRPFWNIEQGFLHGSVSSEELRQLLVEAENSAAKNNILVAENTELKELLGRTSDMHPILATILKRPPFSAYDTLILDVGNDAGLKVGDRVYALGNIPIGNVAEVIGNTSKVRLFSSSGETFSILIGPTNIVATAVGKGGGYFETSMPRDTKIKPGDAVLIPSLSNAFTATVQGIASEASEPFSKVLFRQPVNIYEMRWVVVDVK